MGYKIQPVHSLSSGSEGSAIAPPSKSDNGKVLAAKNGKWVPVKLSSPKLAKVATSGEYKDLKNSPDLSLFISKSEVSEMISAVVGDITEFDTAVVQDLPEEGKKGTLYFLINPDGVEGNIAKEYLYVNGSWELVGDTAIDLTPYVTWDSIGAAAQSNDYEDLDNLPEIPVLPIALSEFINDAGYITLSDIPEVEVPEKLSDLDNDAGFITEADLPEIPENVSAFENDAKYITISEVEEYIKSRCKNDAAAATMGYMANVDGELYDSVAEVFALSENDEPIEIRMTGDVADGEALVLMNAKGDTAKNITLDLNDNAYIAVTAGGSSGTKSQALHLEKGNKVTLKGGSLSAALENPEIKMLIQNYSELVLEDMTIDCSDNDNITYLVSNNFGSCHIKNCHLIAAEGCVAVDCWFGLSKTYDEGVRVTIENSIIEGPIEYGAQNSALSRAGNEEWWEKAVLTIINSRIDEIVNSGADSDPSHCTIYLDGELVGFGDYSDQTSDRPYDSPNDEEEPV